MRKLFLALLAILLVAGVGYAHELSYDPQTSLPNITIPVYNNSGSALTAGMNVIWDIDASTGDDDAYVTTTTTAGTNLVAGVVARNIATGESGAIVIWGLTTCTVTGVAENGTICTSGTAGTGSWCTDAYSPYGICTAAESGGSCNCFVSPSFVPGGD